MSVTRGYKDQRPVSAVSGSWRWRPCPGAGSGAGHVRASRPGATRSAGSDCPRAKAVVPLRVPADAAAVSGDGADAAGGAGLGDGGASPIPPASPPPVPATRVCAQAPAAPVQPALPRTPSDGRTEASAILGASIYSSGDDDQETAVQRTIARNEITRYEDSEIDEEWGEAQTFEEDKGVEHRPRSANKERAQRGGGLEAARLREEEDAQSIHAQPLSRAERVRQRLSHYLRTHWARGDSGTSNAPVVEALLSKTDGAGDGSNTGNADSYGSKRARIGSMRVVLSASPLCMPGSVPSTTIISAPQNFRNDSPTATIESSSIARPPCASPATFASVGTDTAGNTAADHSGVATAEDIAGGDATEAAVEAVEGKPAAQSYPPWLELLLPRALGRGRAALPPTPPPSPLPDDPFAQDPCAPGPLTCDPVFMASLCGDTNDTDNSSSATLSSTWQKSFWSSPKGNRLPNNSISQRPRSPSTDPPPSPTHSEDNAPKFSTSMNQKTVAENGAPAGKAAQGNISESSEYTTASEALNSLAASLSTAQAVSSPFPQPAPNASVVQVNNRIRIVRKPESLLGCVESTNSSYSAIEPNSASAAVVYYGENIRVVRRSTLRCAGSASPARSPAPPLSEHQAPPPPPPPPPPHFADDGALAEYESSSDETWRWTELPLSAGGSAGARGYGSGTDDDSGHSYWTFDERGQPSPYVVAEAVRAPPTPFVASLTPVLPPPGPFACGSAPEMTLSAALGNFPSEPAILSDAEVASGRGGEGERQRRRPCSFLHGRSSLSPSRPPAAFERAAAGEPADSREAMDLRLISQRG